MDIDDDATNATAWPPTINGSHEPPPPMEELQLFLRNVGANEARQHLDLGTTNGTNELASHHGADDDWLRDLDSHDQIQAAIAHLQQQTGQP